MSGQALQQFNDGYNKRLNAQWQSDKEVARAASVAAGGNPAAQQTAVDAMAPPAPHEA
jgi:hypothetical protein